VVVDDAIVAEAVHAKMEEDHLPHCKLLKKAMHKLVVP
jgi:multidrug efflux pump subunit AcrB